MRRGERQERGEENVRMRRTEINQRTRTHYTVLLKISEENTAE